MSGKKGSGVCRRLLCAALTVLMLITLVRSIAGPRFTDRVVAVNMINTMVLAVIAILGVLLEEDFLVDIALVYALLSFLSVVILAKPAQPPAGAGKTGEGSAPER